MEILKIVDALQSYSEDVLADKLDSYFAYAVSEAISLLIGQGEKIAELEESQRWIPGKKPPEVWKDEMGDAINFLAFIPGVGVDIANWIEPARCWFCMGVPCKVTHWKPLPEPPKEL